MSYEFYKVLHLAGLVLLFSGLAGILAVKMIVPEIPARPRRLFFMAHGLGLLIMVVAGFGLAARLGYLQSFPLWLWAKIGIWVVLGGSIALAKRRGHVGGPLLTFFVVLGTTAAWLAVMKPF